MNTHDADATISVMRIFNRQTGEKELGSAEASRSRLRPLAASICVGLFLAACFAPRPSQLPSGPWRQVENVPDCLAFKPYRGRPYDRTIVLDEAFEQRLLSLVDPESVPEPRCWYESPDRSLLLRAGDFCRNPHWVTFGRNGDAWVVTEVRDPQISCAPRARK